jgi:hypothetical protein
LCQRFEPRTTMTSKTATMASSTRIAIAVFDSSGHFMVATLLHLVPRDHHGKPGRALMEVAIVDIDRSGARKQKTRTAETVCGSTSNSRSRLFQAVPGDTPGLPVVNAEWTTGQTQVSAECTQTLQPKSSGNYRCGGSRGWQLLFMRRTSED